MKSIVFKSFFLLLLLMSAFVAPIQANLSAVSSERGEIKFEVQKGFTIEDIIQDLQGANIKNYQIVHVSGVIYTLRFNVQNQNALITLLQFMQTSPKIKVTQVTIFP